MGLWGCETCQTLIQEAHRMVKRQDRDSTKKTVNKGENEQHTRQGKSVLRHSMRPAASR